MQITRAQSFLQKILPNSAGQFAKFRCSLQQNCPNSLAYLSRPFVCKLSFILLKKLQFSDAGMALSYASNIQRLLKNTLQVQTLITMPYRIK